MKKIILFILINIILVPSVLASELGISCPSTVNLGETISCNVTAKVSGDLKGIKGNFSFNGLTYSSFSFSDKFTTKTSNSSGFEVENTNGLKNAFGSGSITIGTLKLKVPSNGTNFSATISGIVGTKMDGSTESISGVKSDTRVKSSDITVNKITVGKYNLNPAFDNNVLAYKVNAEDIPKITITVEPKDSRTTVTGAGEKTLKYGDNTFNIVVSSESGAQKTYKIVVNRFDSRDKTNTLDNLVVTGYDLNAAFNPEKTTYSTTVESNITSVNIKADLTSNKSTFVKNYGPRKVKLNYGKNSFKIKVRAENEVVRTYTINITRIDDRDPNNYLSSLEISSGRYTFNKDVTRYTINVENKVSVVTIKATAASDKAKISFPNRVDLSVGSNKAKITVTAENETKRVYDITINRLKEGTTIEDVENIYYLKSLSIVGKNLKFNQSLSNYTIPITTESEITFEYELLEGVTGTIEIKDDDIGQLELTNQKNKVTLSPIIDGSIIYMSLKSPDGYSRTFTFNIKKADYYVGDVDIPIEKQKFKIKWSWQLISGLFSTFIIICEVAFVIYISAKNGGVENKNNAIQDAIGNSLKDGFKRIKTPKALRPKKLKFKKEINKK